MGSMLASSLVDCGVESGVKDHKPNQTIKPYENKHIKIRLQIL
jgi:hypothetical protein